MPEDAQAQKVTNRFKIWKSTHAHHPHPVTEKMYYKLCCKTVLPREKICKIFNNRNNNNNNSKKSSAHLEETTSKLVHTHTKNVRVASKLRCVTCTRTNPIASWEKSAHPPTNRSENDGTHQSLIAAHTRTFRHTHIHTSTITLTYEQLLYTCRHVSKMPFI